MMYDPRGLPKFDLSTIKIEKEFDGTRSMTVQARPHTKTHFEPWKNYECAAPLSMALAEEVLAQRERLDAMRGAVIQYLFKSLALDYSDWQPKEKDVGIDCAQFLEVQVLREDCHTDDLALYDAMAQDDPGFEDAFRQVALEFQEDKRK